MDKLKLSIVIPVYNSAVKLRRCLKSIFNQPLTHEHYEIIVVDDGSNDGLPEVLIKFQTEHHHIRVIHQPKSGVGKARNNGFLHAKGEYLWFVDADDTLVNGKLTGQFLSNIQGVDVVIFGVNKIAGNRLTPMCNSNSAILDREKFRQQFVKLFLQNIFDAPWNKLYRTSFIIENNIRFESLTSGEDSLFNCQVFAQAHSVYIDSNVRYNYFVSTGKQARKKVNPNFTDEMVLKFQALNRLLDILHISRDNSFYTNEIIDSVIGNQGVLMKQLGPKATLLKYNQLLNQLKIKPQMSQIRLKWAFKSGRRRFVKAIIARSVLFSYLFRKYRYKK